MQKLVLRFALLVGILVGFVSPALADGDDVTLNLILKVSEYSGADGGTVALSSLNATSSRTTDWLETNNILMYSPNRGDTKYNEVSVYAKANEGYTFSHWAEVDSKTTKPAAASTKEMMIYDGNFGYYIKRQLCANPGESFTEGEATAYKAIFHFHVKGLMAKSHHDKYTLYAVFEPKELNITFDADGGSVSPASKKVKYKDPYGTLPTPEKAGYTFDGWFNANSQQVLPTSTKSTTSDETLTAHWTPITYAVHFADLEAVNGEGQPLHTGLVDATYSVPAGVMPDLAASYQLTWTGREDKYFAGYYTQPNGLGVRVYKGVAAEGNLLKGDAFTPTGETTLYAHYTHVHHNMYWDYTYAYSNAGAVAYRNLDEEDGTNRIQNARLTFKDAAGTAIKSVILHAAAVSNIASPTAAFSSHTTVLANIKLSVNETTPTANGATINAADGAHNVYFTDAELSAFRSYTFEPLDNAATPAVPAEWVATTEKDNHETILTYMGAQDPDNNYIQNWSVTLSGLLINPDVIYVMPLFNNKANTESWRGISQLDHTLGVACSKVSESAAGAVYTGNFQVWKGYDNAIGLVGFTLGGQTYYMNTTNPGVFASNYNSADPQNGATANHGTNNEDDGVANVIEMTVPASAIPVIRFQANGGVLSASTPSYLVSNYGANVALTGYAATREGYTFTGWKEDETEGGAVVSSLTVDRAYTLNAQWEGNAYTVTLDLNGGTATKEAVTAHYMADMPALASTELPTRDGYDFQGYWDINDVKYYNADGTSAHAYDKMADATLYAGWQAHTYTVTLDLNDGISSPESTTATYGESFSATVPSWYGHSFLGYFDAETDGTKYIDAEGHCIQAWDKTADATLYAHWELVELTLTAHQDQLHPTDYYTTFYVSNTAYQIATEDVTILIATKADNGHLYLATVAGDIIPAGEAVLLKAAQAEIHLVPVTTTMTKAANNLFEGVDEDTAQEGYKYYVFSADPTDHIVGFYPFQWDTTRPNLSAHKAFYRTTAGSLQAAPRRYVLSQTTVATDIHTQAEKTPANKMLIRGQIVIERNGVRYDVQGRVIE